MSEPSATPRPRTAKYPTADFMRPGDCGAMIGRSPAFVYSLVENGELPGVRLRGVLRLRRADWLSWIEKNLEPATPGSAA